MKWFAYLALAGSLCCAIDVIGEMRSGKAEVSDRYGQGNRAVRPPTTADASAREEFDALIFYQWFWAAALAGSGVLALTLIRKQDKIDPLSASFEGEENIEIFDDEDFKGTHERKGSFREMTRYRDDDDDEPPTLIHGL